jgi:hypothetical protein
MKGEAVEHLNAGVDVLEPVPRDLIAQTILAEAGRMPSDCQMSLLSQTERQDLPSKLQRRMELGREELEKMGHRPL